MRRSLLAVAAYLVTVAAQAGVPEPGAYRMDHYRGPVPETLSGARVVHTAELARLIPTLHPVLIDVLPAPTPPADARPGLPRMPLGHRNLPASLWLPDVGRGELSPAVEAWFRASLQAASNGALSRPMVFYCLSQCWMSWNAARRALSYGYRQVIWYPDGADGWQAEGLPTDVAVAQRLPPPVR